MGVMAPKKLTKKKTGLAFLQIFKKLRPQERKIIVDHLNDPAIDSLGALIFNTFKTDLKLSQSVKNRLARKLLIHKKDLEFIANPSNSIEQRKKRIKKQSGSGLGILLATIVPAIASAIANAAS